MVSAFGGSISFALIVGSNATPTRRFSDQTVRDLLSMAWLFFFLALGMATVGRGVMVIQHHRRNERKDLVIQPHPLVGSVLRYFLLVLVVLVLTPFCILATVLLAYSDVGWAAIIITVLPSVLVLAIFFALVFQPEVLDPFLGLPPQGNTA